MPGKEAASLSIPRTLLTFALVAAAVQPLPAQQPEPADTEADRLVAAMLGDTPLLRDLADLTDAIGGRPTGSEANLRSVEWGLAQFREAGVTARKEAFTMPALWLERSASATVRGDGVEFETRVAAMPFASATPPGGLTGPLLDAGFGTAEDFERLGEGARDAFLLVDTHLLEDIEGLFAEYVAGVGIEERAFAAGAAGVVYVGSRPANALYRHNCFGCVKDPHTMLVLARDDGKRALRLLRADTTLELTARLDLETGGAYESYNVIGEIPGTERPEQIVVAGAHLDSWDLGTGALDNGGNVSMMIDIARQMKRLGIRPARTIRFALWNGEEQGLYGSLGYTRTHADELDDHVMALSVDIGCGRITGFFTNGRGELLPAVERSIKPVAGLGPFQHINAPIVGTDNYDFMMQGVANLVANHEAATYGPNYHAASDQFSDCDGEQLRLNSAIVAALIYGFANGDVDWGRQTRPEIEELIARTNLEAQMRSLGLWESWATGKRGRSR